MERKITAIVRQKRNPECVSIFLDEEYAFGLTRIVAAWLQVGQYLSEEKIDSLQAEDAQEVAYLIAIKYLDYRERSETEIRAHLNKRDINERVIEDVIDRLLRSGLVDDHRFAANWVENRLEFRPRGRRALFYELRQKGISEEIIQETLDPINDEELAYHAAIEKAKKFQSLEWDDFRKKMLGFLSRRGFSYDITPTIMTRVWNELNEAQFNKDTYNKQEVDA
jgi:regulatory protein